MTKAKTKLHIAKDLDLPLDVVMDKKSILAMTGAGKTNTAVDLVEEVLDAGIQVVVIDPKGDWWGMRSSADGKSEGYPITVFGGIHGDIPLEAESGKMLGEYLATNPVSCVLDVSDFSQGELFRFAKDFGIAFYKAKRRNPTAMLTVLEEADEIVPEGVNRAHGPDLPQCIGAWSKIWKRGRFIGIGCLLISQRSAAVNKNLLTQTDMLVIMRTGAPQDIKAVDLWLKEQPDQKKREEILSSIQALPTGDAYVWAPRRKIFGTFHMRMRRTFDAGETPEVGKARIEPKVLAKVDLDRLSGEMKTFVETSRAKDPDALQRRMRELQRELDAERAKKPHAGGADARDVALAVDRATKHLQSQVRDLQRLGNEREKIHARHATRVKTAVDAAISRLGKARTIVVDEAPGPLDGFNEAIAASSTPASTTRSTRTTRTTSTTSSPPPRARPAREDLVDADASLSAPQQRMLDWLAELEPLGWSDVSRAMLAGFAGLSPETGHFRALVGDLVSRGLLTIPRVGRVQLTSAGQARARPRDAPVTRDELQERLGDELSGPQREMLRVLVGAYPEGISRVDLAAKVNLEANTGHYRALVGKLGTLGIVTKDGPGRVRLAGWVMLERGDA